MTASSISHQQFFTTEENLSFYKELLTALGWTVFVEYPGSLGFADGSGAPTLWFQAAGNGQALVRDGIGLNHLAFAADSVATVDDTVAWLAEHNIPALFDTPRHRPDFGMPEGQTYYQVMFETPDKLLLEVVYIGPWSGGTE